MTQTNQAPVNAADAPLFSLQRAYMKGVSLEMPQGAQAFLEQGNPHIELNVNVDSAEIQPGIFEVTLRATMTAKVNDKALYLLEVDQAGIFEVRNIPAENLPQLLEVACPSILLPYLRAQAADMLTRATLPVFHLPEVNWAHMHEQQRAAQAEAKQVPSAQVH